MADSAKNSEPARLCFEDALETLENIVHELEEGQIGLTDALSRYEHGVKLLKQCYEMLEGAQRRIELLSRVGMAGEAISTPFDEAEASLEQKSESRSRRRSNTSRPHEPPEADASDMDATRGLF